MADESCVSGGRCAISTSFILPCLSSHWPINPNTISPFHFRGYSLLQSCLDSSCPGRCFFKMYSLWHEEKQTHKTCIINVCVCVCVCVCVWLPAERPWGFPLLNESAVSMHVPMHPSALHWRNLIPLTQPDIHCHMHCREEARPLHVCVCGPSASLRVCACGIWLWDVEGQVEKWMYRLCVWQPGVSVKLTLTEYGRAAWEDQQLINRQYHNTFWCKWQAKHWDLHAWTCARAVLTVKVTVSLGEGVLQVGAELMNRGFQVCAALLTQFLLHLQSTAGETLRTHLQMISWKRQRIVTSVNKSVNGIK